VAFVKHEERKKIRYSCAPCRPGYGEGPPPCASVCEPKAFSFSDGWIRLYGHK
jgi:Fe-S-cluster-containing hydrogenase component 2